VATIRYEVELDSVTCCVCGMLFAFPVLIKNQRLRDHQPFYCPNGHVQSFTGESDEERLKKQLRNVQEEAGFLRARVAHEEGQRQAAERSLRATKAAHTRTKNRIANGVCPECRRHFRDLDEHMHMEHPGYVQEGSTA
jgi:hypothetical protein